ncbi:hypothetical protein SKAU_G00330330 [Synaphobranchus kaupii]|uniref:Uncharacterized protein n=1 Tax=Synaphobranchus kaupii TaxID=118154 RepID=A0A9Q1EQG9_SYNKA|nr:hypothetical protein SKAU_G00330330 [Synaphobranchus kaupii]
MKVHNTSTQPSQPSRSAVSRMKPVANDVGVRQWSNHTLFLERESQMKTLTICWRVNSREDLHTDFSLESCVIGLLSGASYGISEVDLCGLYLFLSVA